MPRSHLLLARVTMQVFQMKFTSSKPNATIIEPKAASDNTDSICPLTSSEAQEYSSEIGSIFATVKTLAAS
jgi:hypothetical protein